MAVKNTSTYTFKDTFSLNVIKFDEACVFNKSEQVESYTIYWIKEGKGNYKIDFNNYSFNDNVLFFLSPGQMFSVDTEKVKEAYKLTFVRDFYCIQVHDKEVSCNGVLFNNIYETPYVSPCEKDVVKLEFILENLIEEFNNSGAAQYDMLQAYLKQFIIHSVRIKKDNHIIKDDKETKLFKDFSLLVEQLFTKHHSVSLYAERLGVSPKTLSKHFQKLGVQTPSDFIKNRIITEAKRKLIYTDDSIKQIAYDLGFNDPSYFTRFYTKATQKSPLKFKKDYKN